MGDRVHLDPERRDQNQTNHSFAALRATFFSSLGLLGDSVVKNESLRHRRYFFGISAPATKDNFPILHIW
jgi:hypothetical protein